MIIALILLFAGIPLFLFLAPSALNKQASGDMKRNDLPGTFVVIPQAKTESYAFEQKFRGEAPRHG